MNWLFSLAPFFKVVAKLHFYFVVLKIIKE